MKSIEIARTLEACFATRDARRIKSKPVVERFTHGTHCTYIALDLDVSRKLLTAKAFESHNYFREGLDRLEAKGTPARFLKHFFEHGLLFSEGTGHHAVKRRHVRMLDERCDELTRLVPQLTRFFQKRSERLVSGLEFSRLFVRLCLGISISRLTSAPLATSMRALRRRENIFHYHFHPIRQQRMDAALAALFHAIPDGGPSQDSDEWLLAQSLVVMGYDPLIGSLCAALSEPDGTDISGAPARYCPTSFVSRLCREPTTIAGHTFNPGDICYVSLVPSREDADDLATFPFGLGVHTCAGKRFSGAVLNLARTIASRCFPGGFSQTPSALGDGAFLAFKEPYNQQKQYHR